MHLQERTIAVATPSATSLTQRLTATAVVMAVLLSQACGSSPGTTEPMTTLAGTPTSAAASVSAATKTSTTPASVTGTRIAIAAQRLSTGTGSTAISNGIPLAPGALSSSAVAQVRLFLNGNEQPIYIEALQGRFSDGSVRSILIQTNYTFTSSAAVTGDLVIGSARGTTDIAKMAIQSQPTAVVLPTSPDYLVTTGLGGPLVTKAKARQSPSQWGLQSSDFETVANTQWPTPGASWGRAIAGYEYPLDDYQEWLRTGTLLWFQRANAMVMDYRTNYVDKNRNSIAAWWSMTESLAVHYWLTGDDTSRQDIGYMASNQAIQVRTDGVSTYCWGCNQSDGRMKSRALVAAIDARSVNAPYGTGTYAYNATTLTTALNGILQNQNANGSWDGGSYYSGGQKNYMVGMLMESLLRYYNEVSPDPRIPPVIKSSIDYVWKTQWDGTGLKYVSVAGSPSGDGTESEPGLNGFWLYPMTWYAKLSGNTWYGFEADLLLGGLRTTTTAWPDFYKVFDEVYFHVFNAMAIR